MPSLGEPNLAGVEPDSRLPVPRARQTMRLDRVFWSHFSPNLGPGGWVVGVLTVHLGLDLPTAVAAILIGNVVGALPVAFCAAIGPVTGLPQMESARRVFGRAGLVPPSVLNWVYCVGWDAVNNVPAAVALIALLAILGLPAPFAVALGVLAAIQMAAAIRGHDAVQGLQKYLGAVLLVVFAIVGVRMAILAPTLAVAGARPTVPNFVLATAIIASFNLSWASYSSDYTRYLPATTPPGAIVRRAAAALLLSAIPFQLLGLVTASAIGDASPLAVIGDLRHAAGPLAPVVLGAVALSSITGNSVNDNTASYSLLSAGVPVGRVVAAIATASLGYVLAVAGHGRYADLYADYLVLTLYWIAPWTGIVLANWWQDPGPRIDPAASWTAEATLFVAVAAATVALFAASDLYTGPIARALGGADIGYYVGFGVAALGTLAIGRARRARLGGPAPAR